MKRVIKYSFIILLLNSCSKQELGPQCINCDNDFTQTVLTDVIIANEGTFGWSNSSISLYKKTSKEVFQNVYNQVNNNSLGDVIQSITQIDDKAYIVVNNSAKIEVVDINTFKSIATIKGFNSRRYFLPINNNKAYVTDLYSNSIHIVNLNTNIISGSIPVNGWTEELLLYNDTVYVCDVDNDNLLIINPKNNTLIDSVKIGKQPNSIVQDKDNKIWIMCGGGINNTNPKLIKFNPIIRNIENIFTFPTINESPGNLKINSAGNQLYFINSDVYSMSTASNDLPSTPLIKSNNSIYYSLGIDPINEDIYIGDAIDYIQNGIIFRYSSSGSLIDQFNSGIIPGEFLFLQ